MEPSELANRLGISPETLRAWLRRTYPRSDVDHNARWSLTAAQVAAATEHFGSSTPRGASPAVTRSRQASPGRAASDEAYVIDLCDEVLGESSRRQHRFDWLLGDPGVGGTRARLPVDAYYPGHALVVEYRERQPDEPVAQFDKPDRLTVSGVHRGEQRKRYDQRREELIPANGLRSSLSGQPTLRATAEDACCATEPRTSPPSGTPSACSTGSGPCLRSRRHR